VPSVDRNVTSAATVGGTLTCISACAFYGLWAPRTDSIHVAVPPRSRHLKHPLDGSAISSSQVAVILHWSGPRGANTSFVPGVLPIRDCLTEVLHCQSAEMSFAVIESALARRLITDSEIAWLIEAVPSRRRLLRLAGQDAGSGTESLFRYRMANLGISMRSQVAIEGVGRVDFVIGDRLIIEIDSEEHHGGRDHRLRDLDRDAVAVTLDYLPLRFDFAQVMSDWDAVASTVCAVVERGDHLNR
jgi:very-short-patch-repair endonuclease